MQSPNQNRCAPAAIEPITATCSQTSQIYDSISENKLSKSNSNPYIRTGHSPAEGGNFVMEPLLGHCNNRDWRNTSGCILDIPTQ